MKSPAFRRSALACLCLLVVSGAQAATQDQGFQTFYDTAALLPVTSSNVYMLSPTDVLSIQLKLVDYTSDMPSASGIQLSKDDVTGILGASPYAWPSAAIPEPATYALMGLGLVGIALVTRRRASV